MKYQMDNELKRLPNLHLEDTNIMESITKKTFLVAHSIEYTPHRLKTCTPIHHWHSQSYCAASWNATSSFLVSTRTWAVTKSNHHKQELSQTPSANTLNKWKLKLGIRKWLYYKRASKCCYISTLWGLVTTDTAIKINTLDFILVKVGNKLVLLWEHQ